MIEFEEALRTFLDGHQPAFGTKGRELATEIFKAGFDAGVVASKQKPPSESAQAVLQAFLDDCTAYVDGYRGTAVRLVFEKYLEWSYCSGRPAFRIRRFSELLKAAGYSVVHTRVGNVVGGLQLTDERQGTSKQPSFSGAKHVVPAGSLRYVESSSSTSDFCKFFLTPGIEHVSMKEMYQRYSKWARSCAMEIDTVRNLRLALNERGYKLKHTRTGNVWCNVTLLQIEEAPHG